MLRLVRIFKSSFGIALKNIMAVKWKSLISIITIFFGTLGITISFTVSSNIDLYIEHLLNKKGGPKISAISFSRNENIKSTFRKTLEMIPYTKSLNYISNISIETRHDDENFNMKIYSRGEDSTGPKHYNLLYGRDLQIITSGYENEIIISKESVTRLKVVNPLSQFIKIPVKPFGDMTFKIIGVAAPIEEQYDQGMGWITHATMGELKVNQDFNELHVYLKKSEHMTWMEAFLSKFLQRQVRDFYIFNPLQEFNEKKRELMTFLEYGFLLGWMTLLAGTVGSTSVMILNITLRRREIGLYKALGFGFFVILVQFSCETIMLSGVGGILGSFLGTAIGLMISKTLFPVVSFSIYPILIGILSAVLTGFLFGLIPSYIAAKMDPIKALQG